MTNIFAEFHKSVKVPQAEQEWNVGSRPRVQLRPVNQRSILQLHPFSIHI